jgi:hypothetical protein
MIKSKDYMNQIEGWYNQKLFGLTEMEDITEGIEPKTEKGKVVVKWIQEDLITLDQLKEFTFAAAL